MEHLIKKSACRAKYHLLKKHLASAFKRALENSNLPRMTKVGQFSHQTQGLTFLLSKEESKYLKTETLRGLLFFRYEKDKIDEHTIMNSFSTYRANMLKEFDTVRGTPLSDSKISIQNEWVYSMLIPTAENNQLRTATFMCHGLKTLLKTVYETQKKNMENAFPVMASIDSSLQYSFEFDKLKNELDSIYENIVPTTVTAMLNNMRDDSFIFLRKKAKLLVQNILKNNYNISLNVKQANASALSILSAIFSMGSRKNLNQQQTLNHSISHYKSIVNEQFLEKGIAQIVARLSNSPTEGSRLKDTLHNTLQDLTTILGLYNIFFKEDKYALESSRIDDLISVHYKVPNEKTIQRYFNLDEDMKGIFYNRSTVSPLRPAYANGKDNTNYKIGRNNLALYYSPAFEENSTSDFNNKDEKQIAVHTSKVTDMLLPTMQSCIDFTSYTFDDLNKSIFATKIIQDNTVRVLAGEERFVITPVPRYMGVVEKIENISTEQLSTSVKILYKNELFHTIPYLSYNCKIVKKTATNEKEVTTSVYSIMENNAFSLNQTECNCFFIRRKQIIQMLADIETGSSIITIEKDLTVRELLKLILQFVLLGCEKNKDFSIYQASRYSLKQLSIY